MTGTAQRMTPRSRSAHEALAASPIFGELEPGEIEDLLANAYSQVVMPGAEAFSEGAPNGGVWVLASGRMRLVQASADGRQRISRFCAPGDVLNLTAALDGGLQIATALATDLCTVLYITAPLFEDLCTRRPQVYRNAVRQLCVDIRQQETIAAIDALKGAKERVGCALMHLARQYGVPTAQGTIIDYRVSRQDIADRVGARSETAIRMLSSLTALGLIRTRDQRIEIVDVEGLKEATSCLDCQLNCLVFGPPLTDD